MSYQVRLWTFVIKYELRLASDVSKYLIKQSYSCINVTALVESKWWSKEPNRTLNICSILTLGRTRKFITPSCYKGGGGRGGWWWNPPRVLDMLQHFETILPLLEGQTAPHWTAHTIGCENNRITTQTITLTLNTKGNIVLDNHLLN